MVNTVRSETITIFERQFESKVVRYCAPTLAGVKPSNLFNCAKLGDKVFNHANSLHGSVVASCQSKIARGGVSLSILLQRASGALVLVYREDAVAEVLEKEPSREFLERHGYDISSPFACVASLRQRMIEHECARQSCEQCEFPHEIGLLLGYPFDDVMGFIENKGHFETCLGTWKVYLDEASAVSTFECYKRLTKAFVERFDNGISIDELALEGCYKRKSA